jgi:hypothetical protein
MAGRFRVARFWIYLFVVLCLVFNILLIFHVNNKVEKQRWEHTISGQGSIWDAKKQKKTEQRGGRHQAAPRDGPCLRRECILEEAKALARAFPLKSDVLVSTTTTTTNNNNNNALEKESSYNNKKQPYQPHRYYGLLYVKVPKTASSTAAGAALRIGKKYNIPVAAHDHSWPLEQGYQNRHPTQSFLFASIRDPTDRAISYLSYTASRMRTTRTTNINNNNSSKEEEEQQSYNMLHHLKEMDRSGAVVRSEGRGGAQLYFTSLYHIPKDSAWRRSHPTYVSNPRRVRDNVRRVLDSYDFFLVTDRMEESLVAMALLLTMGNSSSTTTTTMEDVLAFSSKRSSSNQYLPVRDTTDNNKMVCVPLQQP